MQINATIIAAQQAAREARAALIAPKPPAASFLTELKSQEAGEPAAPRQAAAATPAPQAPTRPGSLINIVI